MERLFGEITKSRTFVYVQRIVGELHNYRK